MGATRRIVSLVPSLTETVCDLGLRPALVGCTQFCIEPAGLHRTAQIVGGTKNPDLDKIAALKPTHIIVNEEENKPEHIAACRKLAPTLVSFPKTPRDVPPLLREMTAWLGVSGGEERAAEIEAELLAVEAARDQLVSEGRWQAARYLYLIWREPYMVAAKDTYISSMMELVGFENAAQGVDRYPTMSVDAMKASGAEVLLLSSEPYPFRKRDAARLAEDWPSAPRMLKVDGQMLSWYGTRLLPALRGMKAWMLGEEQTISRPF